MQKNKKTLTYFYSKGFTLIELLVVVAVIGLLASVVLSALNNARGKGADAGIKSNLNGAQKQAEIFYIANTAAANTYTNVCTNGIVGGAAGIGVNVLAAAKASGLGSYATDAVGSLTTATCNDSAGAWAAEAPLKNVANTMWCVDSNGKSKQEAASSLTTATTYTCI